MNIEELISPTVPVLMPTDSGERALTLMDENHFRQLPLVQDEKYMALVQEHDVIDWNTPEKTLNNADFLNYHPAVFANGHPYDALRIAYQQQLSVIPVIDNDNTYLGAITKDSLLKYMGESSGVDNPGGIIVIEVAPRDYSLAEIARICENEEVMIISSQLKNNVAGKIEVTLKTNRADLQGLASSFERHNYVVREVYGQQNNFDDAIERYNELMNYINM